MSITHVDFRTARAAALDTPADLELARQRFAPYKALPISRETEVLLQQIRQHEIAIAKHAEQIRWLRLSIETA